VSLVHALPSSQLSAVPGAQTPPWQVSAPSHALLLLHDVPFATFVIWQMPALHTSFVQGLLSLHSLLTLHGMQPAICVCSQPVSALHESMVQAFPSLQLGAVPGLHVPDWQVSEPLHWSPSLQDAPFARLLCLQPVTASHVSAVQGLPSSQLSGVPARQAPPWHTSAPLQTVLSAQDAPLTIGLWKQPVVALHESVVHGLPSLQSIGSPGLHWPAWQVSMPLHTLASGHGVLLVTGT